MRSFNISVGGRRSPKDTGLKEIQKLAKSGNITTDKTIKIVGSRSIRPSFFSFSNKVFLFFLMILVIHQLNIHYIHLSTEKIKFLLMGKDVSCVLHFQEDMKIYSVCLFMQFGNMLENY